MESAYSAWPHCPGATPASCSRSSLLTPPRLSLPLKSRAIPLLIQHDPPLLRCGHKTPLCLADRKSTRLNSSHVSISYAVFCLKKKIKNNHYTAYQSTIQ